jgi:indolepyruvate ferredoxin oxidoreductase beta subunit
LSSKCWVVPATDEALKQGNPVFANIILIGALIGTSLLPLDRKAMEPVLREDFPKQFDANIKFLDKGMELVKK